MSNLIPTTISITKPWVSIKLDEGSPVRLALPEIPGMFTDGGLSYVPWYLWDGKKGYDFGFNKIRSAPTAEILGWHVHSQFENHIYHRSNLKAGTFEWVGPDEDSPTLTVKWEVKRGCLVDLEKIEAWIQHWSFKTWVQNIPSVDVSNKAQEIGRWYWEVRKSPELVYKLMMRARKQVDKPVRTVGEVMEHYTDRFHEAHKWCWFYGGCKSDELSGVFSKFRVFCDAPLKQELDVPGVGMVTVRPAKWVNVPPFRVSTPLPKPINDEGDDELTNELLRIPVTRPRRAVR